jgi:hypothetical protein
MLNSLKLTKLKKKSSGFSPRNPSNLIKKEEKDEMLESVSNIFQYGFST